jgi:vacuolar-type H+-ATPase subunit C/Vma6
VENIITLIRISIRDITERSMKYLLIALGNLKFDEIKFLREVKQSEYFLKSIEECIKDI